MDAAFWHDKWERGLTGFHLTEINPYLAEFWPRLSLPSHAQVLVPLCGKSLDLAYLASLGHGVCGIELNTLAVEALFAELGTVPEPSKEGEHKRYQLDELTVLQGDFFSVTPAQLPAIDAFYDRAAMVALPESMRGRYVEQLAALLPRGAVGLLVSLEYPQQQMSGPPFSVEPAEIERLLSPYFELQSLACFDVLAQEPRFVAKGVSSLQERVYRLVRR